ncbi:MAG TPA: hypothetical protein DCM05_05880 [Elusimicrobia bacterium]|nr:hypothetical protein [Elusimicrobiota bacterium]
MANPELVAYIRAHLQSHGEAAVREQLLADGIAPEEVDAAFAAIPKPKPPHRLKGKLAVYAVCVGVLLIAVAGYLSLEKPPEDAPGAEAPPPSPDAPAPRPPDDAAVFKGHYGYMLKLPAGYQAAGAFSDALKTHEVVHLYPAGTNPTHFIHEGLYGQLGLVRLEASPRRRPEGLITVEVLKAIAAARMKTERAVYTSRSTLVNGMPAFIVSITQPFAQVKGYLVGQKVYYVVTAGSDNELFNGVLETLIETDPHDRPG